VTVDTSDLWVCPSCGKRLVTTNMWHSCGPHTVEDLMAGKSEVAWSYWNRLCEMVGECGPYSIVANKTRLVFMVRVRFAGMDAVSDRGMSFSFWLKQPIDDARFRKVVHYGGTTGTTRSGSCRSTSSTPRCSDGCACPTRSAASVPPRSWCRYGAHEPGIYAKTGDRITSMPDRNTV
jgi:hypothetical protein